MAGKFSIEAVFKAIDRISGPVSKMSNRVGKFTRKMSRQFSNLNRQVTKFGRNIRTAGFAAAASLFIIGNAAADTIGTFAQFEQSLVNASARFGGNIDRGTKKFQELEDVARKMGRTTEFTASQAAQGLNFLALAGFNAEQAITSLPGLINLATAAQIDLARASDIATDTLGAFNLTSKDAATNARNLARVNDVLAKTTTSANTDMEMLFETIKGSAAVAAGGGGSIETFAALAGTMANSSLKASQAGTALKNVFLRLAAPVGSAAQVLRNLGVKTQDSQGNLRDMLDILGDMEVALEGFGTAEKSAILNNIFGLRAITGANILLNKGAKALKEYRTELENSTGAADRMAMKMRDTLLGRFKTLVSAIESVKISATKLRQSELEKLIETMTEWTRTIDSVINSNQKLAGEVLMDLIKIIVSSLKILGLFIAAFVVMRTVVLAAEFAIIAFNVVMFAGKALMLGWTILMPVLTAAMAAFRLVMLAVNIAMWANPVGVLILGITALVGLAVLLISNWGKVSGFFVDLWDGIKSTFKDGLDFINMILTPFQELTSGIKNLTGNVSFLVNHANVANDNSPEIVSPQERVAREFSERKETSNSFLTIKDETGRAELAQSGQGPGSSIKMLNTGSF